MFFYICDSFFSWFGWNCAWMHLSIESFYGAISRLEGKWRCEIQSFKKFHNNNKLMRFMIIIISQEWPIPDSNCCILLCYQWLLFDSLVCHAKSTTRDFCQNNWRAIVYHDDSTLEISGVGGVDFTLDWIGYLFKQCQITITPSCWIVSGLYCTWQLFILYYSYCYIQTCILW